MLNIYALQYTDVGRWVEYAPSVGNRELGRIKSWNDKYVFVVYHCDQQWHRFQDYTAAATNPEDLSFLEESQI